MPTPQNLYEFYKSQGKPLPSVAERAKLYGDPNYTGTAEQNAAQLAKLQAPTPAPVPVPANNETMKKVSVAASQGKITDQASLDAFTGKTPPTPYTPPVQTPAESYLSTYTPPKTEEEIIAEKTKNAQGQIDSLNTYYDTLVKGEEIAGADRSRRTDAISTLTGLAGSSEATTAANETSKLNTQAIEKINAERGAAIQSILSDIQTRAVAEAQQSRLEARQSAEASVAMRKETVAKATEDITMFAKNGVTSEGLKAISPDEYTYLAQQVGGEANLKQIITLNRPQEQIIDKKVENGKYVIAYQNPIDGKIRIETLDLGIPPQYTKSVDIGDSIMFVPDNFNPATDTPIYVPKGISPDAAQKNSIASYNAETSRINATKEKPEDALNQYSDAFTPGVVMADGTPTIDENNFVTPVAWKAAIKEAPSKGISRRKFIQEFGYLLYTKDGKVDPSYGLTPAEIKLIGTPPQETVTNPFG